MRERSLGICEKHQLPLDDRGSCQLCRLSGVPSQGPPARTGRWIGVLLVVAVLVGGGAIGYAMFSSVERAAPERGVLGRSAERVDAGVVLRQPESPSSVPLPPPPPPDRRAIQAPPPAAPIRVEPARDISEDQARAALGDVRIVMYSTDWCGSCRRAREYLNYNGISYTEYDIDEDADAKERLAAINPRTSIPTFQIDEAVQIGFSPESLEARINQAVRARLESRLR